MTISTDMEKKGPIEIEDKVQVRDTDENVDYSGAVAKTDQVEIALVRKLDWRIMPTLWAMYFL